MEYIANFFSSKPPTSSTQLSNELSNELCSNLKRVSVTKKVLKYINDNKLQDKNDANSVILDDTLADYLNLEYGKKLTYYEIQELIDVDKCYNSEITNNGFLRPLKLSDDLCQFLEIEPNSRLSRVDVTRKLCAYIDVHELKDENIKRIVILNEPLANLFNSKVGERVMYYDLQKFLQPHFLK